MTVTLTYLNLTTIINDSALAAATAEAIMDHAINKIALNGYALANLSGSAGSKTGTYTQAEAGAIIDVATTIYAVNYKNSGSGSTSLSLGNISQSSSTSTGSQQSINDSAMQAARTLKTQSSDPPVYIANAELPDQY
jgi:hypothetical protein